MQHHLPARVFSRPFNMINRFGMFALILCGSALVGSIAAPAAAQTTVFETATGSCAGCGICLDLNQSRPDPFRITNACSSLPGCGPGGGAPYRFGDLSALRGLIQVITESDDPSCFYSLFGRAAWVANGANVQFTGPPGETTVLTRVRFIVSTASSGTVNTNFSGRFNDPWGMAIPPNVTGMEIISPFEQVGLNS